MRTYRFFARMTGSLVVSIDIENTKEKRYLGGSYGLSLDMLSLKTTVPFLGGDF